MFLEILLDNAVSAYSKQLVQIVILQVNLLLSLLNDSLDLAAIQEDNFVVKESSFNPQQVIDFVIRLFQPQAQMQQTNIRFKQQSV